MDPAQRDEIENRRLASLTKLNLLDSPFEERFDRIVRLATRIFSCPIAGIALVDKDRVWFKSIIGLQSRQVQRSTSFENRAIEESDGLIIEDIANTSDFSANPLVIAGPRIGFWAGYPISSKDNQKVGVFFIADRAARKLSEIERSTLKDLSLWSQLEVNCNANTFQSDPSYLRTKEELSKKNRELAEAKAKNEAMLENIGDGIIGINDGGEVVYMNSQAERMLGYSRPELLGKMLIHAVVLVDEEGAEVPLDKRPIRTALLSKKKIESRDFFYMRKDGSRFAVAITATPIVLYGQVVGGVNVFRDITREYEIDRMKTEFISLASHQLRTPLSAMKWFSEMLLDGEVGPLNEEQRELTNNIYQSNERMIGLVNALLNISRIESGRIIIEPEPTDLKVLVEEVVGELKPAIDEKKHHLAISVHEKLPLVNIDPKLVRHVYVNLISNAIKYTKEGGEIEVMISKSGNEIVSRISDNGYGIPKNQKEKVFSKFFRGKNVVKTVTSGTGLGLYLVKAIVDSSGGKIWFESEEGKGTTFWFILPLQGSYRKEGEVSLDT